MRHTTALLAATLLLAGAAVGCSSGKSAPDRTPTATITKTARATATVDAVAACTDAIAAGKDKGDGAPECADLSPDDYFKALQAANKRGRDALESAIASASAEDVGR